MNEQTTVELATVGLRRESRIAKVWRGASGAMSAGMVLLALGVIVVQFYAVGQGLPGPGLDVVTAHAVTAVFAVLGQHVADRRQGWLGALCVLPIVVVGFGTLWIFWWA